MNIEEIRQFCLSLPYATEDMAFGPDHLLFRIGGRIFACCSLTPDCRVAVKCDPDLALTLRDRFTDIRPAWHWNKKYWNEFTWSATTLPLPMLQAIFRHSYRQAAGKLPRAVRLSHPDILTVSPHLPL